MIRLAIFIAIGVSIFSCVLGYHFVKVSQAKEEGILEYHMDALEKGVKISHDVLKGVECANENGLSQCVFITYD